MMRITALQSCKVLDRDAIIKTVAECYQHPTTDTSNLILAGCGDVILSQCVPPASIPCGGFSMSNPATRRCLRCGEEKPLEDFYLRKNGLYGRNSQCKPCAVQTVLDSRRKNIEKFRAYQREYKRTEKAKATRQAWADTHPGYQREWQSRSPEKRRQYTAKWFSRRPTYFQEWREKNRDKLRAADRRYHRRHPERMAEQGRQWREKNPHIVRHHARVRRARKRAAEGAFTISEWQSLCLYYDYTCLCCGKSEPEIRLVPDHVIPLSLGGSNSIGNIQPLCSRCNGVKFTKTTDYRPGQGRS